jgi:hypothetical protein
VRRGVNMNKYRVPEMIKPNYVTLDQVKKMIDDKYRRGAFNIKSEDEIKKLYEVAENVFNNMEDPDDALKTVSASNYNRNLTNKLYEISNNVSQQQLSNIIDENIKIENENNLNVPSLSSSAYSDLDSFKEEDNEKLLPGESGDSEDDTDTGGESSNEILPEDPNALIQNNNSGANRQLTQNQILRRQEYNKMTGDRVLNNNK